MDIDIFIDSLTNCLVCSETGEECDTEYCLVTRTITKQDAADLRAQGWKFDWSIPQQKGYEVYELVLEKDEMCIRDRCGNARDHFGTGADHDSRIY